jgi:hypothetical protein
MGARHPVPLGGMRARSMTTWLWLVLFLCGTSSAWSEEHSRRRRALQVQPVLLYLPVSPRSLQVLLGSARMPPSWLPHQRGHPQLLRSALNPRALLPPGPPLHPTPPWGADVTHPRMPLLAASAVAAARTAAPSAAAAAHAAAADAQVGAGL